VIESEYLKALALGIVEGITEFLPISSTGHLIVASDLLDFRGARANAFNLIIQVGAILAVIWEYRRKIVEVVRDVPRQADAQRFAVNLIVAFLPAAIMGVLFADAIEERLFNPVTVAMALLAGGFLMLYAERRNHIVDTDSVDAMDWKHALKIGCAQCLALIPGTSRAAATIIGGLWFGLSRRAATEFSFFLAMPTLTGAAVYSGWQHRILFTADDVPVFVCGFVTAFICALLAVRGLLRFIGHHSFAAFAWYRIAFGVFILATWQFGWIDWNSG
jgi:undecaprenyl-diphosphatase